MSLNIIIDMSAEMAKKYEAAWNQLFYKEPEWRQRAIIEEPHGRHAGELAAITMRLAERGKLDIGMSGGRGELELQMPPATGQHS